MGKWLILLFLSATALFVFIYPKYAKNYSLLLSLKTLDKDKFPRNFHKTPFYSSGSAQFSERGLDNMIKEIPANQILIVDLRQEEHGFLNGMAITWYSQYNWGNIHMTTKEILKEEQNLVDRLGSMFWTLVYHDRQFPFPYRIKTTRTEKELTQLHRVQYLRFPITDHRRPTDSDVDAFVEWIQNLPKETWLHFHCSAGKGRTTTFLAMQDMMLNAQKDSFETIIKRQNELGGINLLNVSQADKDKWKRPYIETRAEFIKYFYEYCRETPYFTTNWSKWIENKEENSYSL